MSAKTNGVTGADRGAARSGMVYLVGGGPGDPGMLTLRAAELLATADVVAYDALISDAVLAMVRAGAELVPVGHRGKGSSRALYRIHPDVIEHARAGRTVVRLKCGDPFVFGRGGEEAEELRDAGIAFEVVPGISSVLGAAARAGIPLTHRLVSSDVTLATGHDLLAGAPSASDWSKLARGEGTLVLFMAARKLRDNLDRLLAHGRSPQTPAAYIACATTARQKTIVGTLGDLVEKTAGVDRDDPALIILGEVVRLREHLAWWEQRPLSGRRVLVARARPGASEIATRLRHLGAEVTEAPQIEVAALRDHASFDGALARAGSFDALVFSCASGVEATLRRLGELGHDVRRLNMLPLVAIGRQAAERLRAVALQPAIVAEGACADAVGAHASLLRGGRLLLVTAEEGRPVLVSELAALGASIETTAAYRTIRRLPLLGGEGFDVIVVPSSSAASAIYEASDGRLLRTPVVVLGPSAEAAARRHGAVHVMRSEADTISSAVSKVLDLLAERGEASLTVGTTTPPSLSPSGVRA